MVHTEAIDVVVVCVIVDDFVEMQFDALQLKGVSGRGSGVTSAMEFGSWKASRSFVVPRSEDSLTTEASFWTT